MNGYLQVAALLCANSHHIILLETCGAASSAHQLLRQLPGILLGHVEGDCVHSEGLGLEALVCRGAVGG